MAEAAKRFEDLTVFQEARKLLQSVYAATREAPFSKDYALVNQVRRAAVSIMANIAEGFERNGNAEFIQFLYIAKGSCGEVRAELMAALDQKYIDAQSYDKLDDKARHVGSMLSNLISYLKKSGQKGAKYVGRT
jgi:four helix bundle protein